MRDTERKAETQAEGEAGSMQGARCGTPSQVSRIMPRAAGGAKPLRPRGCPRVSFLKDKSNCATPGFNPPMLPVAFRIKPKLLARALSPALLSSGQVPRSSSLPFSYTNALSPAQSICPCYSPGSEGFSQAQTWPAL